MKKIRIVFGLSLALAVLAALAFANNAVAVVRWWRAFLASGGDTAGLAAHAPGFLAWLDWSAVDYSAVTTFIPMLGFICLARASWLLMRASGRRGNADPTARSWQISPSDFPFFPGSDQLNVALGLFGTLWGIIVIGYFKLETVTMADLMQCLHTALFSTLMAVVWVFLIDRPLVRPLFRKLLDESNLAKPEEGNLAAAVDRFIERLDAASESFDVRQRQYEAAFEKRQREYVDLFQKQIAELEKRTAAAETRAQSAEKKLDQVALALKA